MQNNNSYDCIIVGQGIAGCFMAFQYCKRGQNVLVIDADESMTSSQVAAGIINPVTGRNFVKSWMFDDLWDYLIPFYHEFEQFLNKKFFYPLTIFRALPTAKEFNDWSIRSESIELTKVLSEDTTISKFESFLKTPDFFTAFNGGRLDTNTLMTEMRSYLQTNQTYLQEEFDFEQLGLVNGGVSYRDFTATKIVFCEGYRGLENPYFQFQGLNPFRGDIFEVETEGINTNDIIKNDLFFVPISSDKLWVGTANSFNRPGSKPKEKAIDEMRSKLSNLLITDFKITAEKGAFRPSVKDRRPLLGKSNISDAVYMLNGLGSKGSSLGPFFSQHLYDYIENFGHLMKEVDVKRYFDL